MNHDPELTLAQAAPPELPKKLRGRVLTQARRAARWRKIERVWGWSLAMAALLLVCLNLHYAPIHEQRMLALTGPPSIERPVDAKAYVQRFQQRQRLLLAWATDNFPSDLREDAL
ncbi:MAG: hypothetical protein ACYC63_15690 [Armatimonadota bacterium]